METFADYILSEKDWIKKMEIMHYLKKKTGVFFDKSVVFKAEIARKFLNYSKIEVDKNLVLTASLLCNCKKPCIDSWQKRSRRHCKTACDHPFQRSNHLFKGKESQTVGGACGGGQRITHRCVEQAG